MLVYAAAGRGVHERKRARALDLLEEAEFGLSGQVLQEFFVTVTQKAKQPLSRTDAAEWIAKLSLRPVVPSIPDSSYSRSSLESATGFRTGTPPS